MAHAHSEGFCCGHRALHYGRGGREPFILPGTTKRYAPDRAADIRHTSIHIELDPAVVAIRGVVAHTFVALHDETTRLLLHADELTIDAVETPDGDPLVFDHSGHELTVTLPEALSAGSESTIRVRYHGAPRRGLYFIAPDEDYPDKPIQAWTQGQDEDSRFWFPCFDHPSEKMSTEMRARVPSAYQVLSNGALVRCTPHEDGTVTWHWKQALPHSAYLVTLVVGEFDELTLREGDTPLTALVPKGRLEDAERAFGRTARMVDHFSERYGITYPYEKYAQVVVEDFIFGGMENTTATTLIDVTLYDERAALDFDMDHLVAHELAHQWWGDLLTCRDWSHAWLNEGFATWSENVWLEEDKGLEEADYDRLDVRARYMAEDGGAYRRPIVEQSFVEPIDVFDRHLYEKGSLVLHMLRFELGEESFWRAVRTYAKTYRGKTVVTEDLRRAIEQATGRNLDWFFDQWVYSAGHPELDVSWTYDADKGHVALHVKQVHAKEAQTVETFRFDVEVGLVLEDGTARTLRVPVRRKDQTFHLDVEAKPAHVLFDPREHTLATFKVTQPVASNKATLASDAAVPVRVRCAAALAKDPTSESIEALDAALADAFWGVAAEAAKALGGTRRQDARDALLRALAREDRPKVRRAIVTALGNYLRDAKAGDALRHVLEVGDASIFVEGAAAHALGRTRVEGAQQVLEEALATKESWAEVIRAGCVRGLAALGTEAVVPALVTWGGAGKPMRLRQAVAAALSAVGRRLTVRTPILEALGEMMRGGDFRLVMASIAAIRDLGDEAGLPLLGVAPSIHPDGRVVRATKVASRRLRKGGTRTTEVAKLADTVEELQGTVADLRGRLERLEK